MSPSASAIQVRRWPGSRRSASSKTLPMVTSRPAVMSVVYQRFTARGAFLPLPGSGCMTCPGVRAGPAGTWTSKTQPVRPSACGRPFPRCRAGARSSGPACRAPWRCPPGLGTHRHALAVAESASAAGPPSARPGPLLPVPGLPDPGRPVSATGSPGVIYSTCRLPMLTPVAASTSSVPSHTSRTGWRSLPAAGAARNTRSGEGPAPRRAGKRRHALNPGPVRDPPHAHRPSVVTTLAR